MVLNLALQQACFYGFAAFVVTASLMVILARNPVHSALYLVAAFVGSAAIWILLEAEFLGLVLILVYVGAVMTLFLFVVMMLKTDMASLKRGFVRYMPFAALVSVSMLVVMYLALGPAHFGLTHFSTPVSHSADYSNIMALGEILYTKYLYPFELAAVILLVALIAAIGLTFRGPQSRKRQEPIEQMMVKREDRLRIVKVDPVHKPKGDEA